MHIDVGEQYKLRAIIVTNGRAESCRHTYLILWGNKRLVVDDLNPLVAHCVKSRESFVVEFYVYSRL
jgi:hypothetical protein